MVIAITLMIIGGILLLIAFLGLLALLLEPMYKTFRIVIRREDDYAHYTAPDTIALLNEERRKYKMYLAGIALVGGILFFTGWYLRYGSRGLDTLFAIGDESPEEGVRTISRKIDEEGRYLGADEKTYEHYLLVYEDQIYYGADEKIGDTAAFEVWLSEKAEELLLVDRYAYARTFREAKAILNEQGIHEYETAEE